MNKSASEKGEIPKKVNVHIIPYGKWRNTLFMWGRLNLRLWESK